MLAPGGLEKVGRGAMLVALVLVVVIAPLVGCFAFSPMAVAWGIQPYPLAAALGVMAAETLGIAALLFFARNSRR